MARLKIRKETRRAECYTEDLGGGVGLDMVKIPAGRFQMGSPEDEPERFDREGSQHEVTVPEFYMGRYPVTQGQWKALVEATEAVDRDLDPDPSHFKGDYEGSDRWSRPVERVSWYDAKEFCARLSQKTGRDYRLPSEAEWEYACRAGTTTPFHFGETIATSLANYCGEDREIGGTTYSGSYGSASYGRGSKGEYREQTTPVGYFKFANPFGLYDMHGNVWEWCEDDYHGSYEKAPDDGSAWPSGEDNTTKILRGGSWVNYPRYCRCALRDYFDADISLNGFGFRVLRSPPRTL